ncbi:MAG: hypothetical protein ACLFVU_03180 [Phycisphaerae bacterium]
MRTSERKWVTFSLREENREFENWFHQELKRRYRLTEIPTAKLRGFPIADRLTGLVVILLIVAVVAMLMMTQLL